MVFIQIEMVIDMKVIIKMGLKMAKENSIIKMVVTMKEIGWVTR